MPSGNFDQVRKVASLGSNVEVAETAGRAINGYDYRGARSAGGAFAHSIQNRAR